MTLSISMATADDASALAECAAVTFPLACPPGSLPEDIAQHIATKLSAGLFEVNIATPGHTILCLREGERVMGYTMVVLDQTADAEVVAALTLSPVAELSKFYVHPDLHGQGAAAALMSATLERAAESKFPGIWLGVNQENARALRFYTKHGFRIVGTRRFRLGTRFEDDYTLERALPTGAVTTV